MEEAAGAATSIRLDLNVQLPDGAVSAESVREQLRLLVRLGYGGAAVARPIARRLTRKDANKTRPINLGDGDEKTGLRQHTRLTATLAETADTYALSSGSEIAETYDLVAAVPQTEQLFEDCCRRLNIDLISLDLTERVPFRLSLPAVAAAIARGVHFEICYAPALHDSATRRNIVANAQQLLRLTRGRNIVLSSGALRPMDLRGAHDVANLGISLLGMPHDCAHKAVGSNLTSVLKRAKLRRGGGLQVEPMGDGSSDVGGPVRREQISGMIQIARQNSSAEAAGRSRKRKLGSVAARLVAGSGHKKTGGGTSEEVRAMTEDEEETNEAEAPRSADFLAL